MEEGVKMLCHFSNDGSDFGNDSKVELSTKLIRGSSAHVRVDPFIDVAALSRCRINNNMDLEVNPYPPVIIQERCNSKVRLSLLLKVVQHYRLAR